MDFHLAKSAPVLPSELIDIAIVRDIGSLTVTSGRVVVADAFECIHFFPLDCELPLGEYAVQVCERGTLCVAAVLNCDRGPVSGWVPAKNQWHGDALVGVDSGTAAFADYSPQWSTRRDYRLPVSLIEEGFRAVTFRTAGGRGAYRIWYGLNRAGEITKIAVDCSR